MTAFNVEERWPELFASLDALQRDAVRQSLASAWHEGWNPNREDVENLTDYTRGAINFAEYRRRSHAAAAAIFAPPKSPATSHCRCEWTVGRTERGP